MSNFNLDVIAENATRLGARLQETISEHTRELALNKGAYLDAPDDKLKNVRQQLDAGSDREKLEAMRRLIALISKGRNVSEYFAQVVKNVASHSIEVRKLVYIYLLRYAEQEPDLALLSINTFQKDLNDSNPLIRAMALRVLSGIKVPMIGSIVVLAIKKCAADPSPYVRKAAAFAIPKCYSLDPSHQPALIGIISNLLSDRSPLSIGSVAIAFEAVCPTRLDLLHSQYRRLCRTLADVDEWGQVNMIELLLRYVRTMLPRPAVTKVLNKEGMEVESEEEVDPDLQLLLTSSENLFMSRNPAVILAVSRVFYYVAPPSQVQKIVQPLLRILQTSKEVERVVLAYLAVICQHHAALFASDYTRFLIRAEDGRAVKRLKMQIFLMLINQENHQALLREFVDYALDVDEQLVSDAMSAIGYCARLIPTCEHQALTALLAFIQNPSEVVVSSAVLVLKSLVQLQASTSKLPGSPQAPLAIVSKLAYKLDEIRHPDARACVIWLVGQYSAAAPGGEPSVGPAGVAPWAPDVLRKSAKAFTQEQSVVKLQIVTMAAKLVVLCPTDQTLCLLAQFVFLQARYDTNNDVRDRARMLSTMLTSVAPLTRSDPEQEVSGVVLRREQVRLILFDGKGVPTGKELWNLGIDGGPTPRIGSLSTVLEKDNIGDRILPDWLEQGAEPSLRDSPDDVAPTPIKALGSGSGPRGFGSPALASPIGSTPISGSPMPTRGAFTDLDKFYDDTPEQGAPEESEEEESEGDESESDEDGTDAEDSDDDSSEDDTDNRHNNKM